MQNKSTTKPCAYFTSCTVAPIHEPWSYVFFFLTKLYAYHIIYANIFKWACITRTTHNMWLSDAVSIIIHVVSNLTALIAVGHVMGSAVCNRPESKLFDSDLSTLVKQDDWHHVVLNNRRTISPAQNNQIVVNAKSTGINSNHANILRDIMIVNVCSLDAIRPYYIQPELNNIFEVVSGNYRR